MKFYIGQQVNFEMVGKRHGTIMGFHNGIYQVKCSDAVFGLKEEDLRGN